MCLWVTKRVLIKSETIATKGSYEVEKHLKTLKTLKTRYAIFFVKILKENIICRGGK